MYRYGLIMVDGTLAIHWEDETREEAAERARRNRELSSRVSVSQLEVRDSRVGSRRRATAREQRLTGEIRETPAEYCQRISDSGH